MSFVLPPRRNPGDVIRSGEWNQIIDALANLNTRVSALEALPPPSPGGDIIGVAMSGFVLEAGTVTQVQPFTGQVGASRGLTLPVRMKFKRLVIDVLDNTLDGEAAILARHNESSIIASITVPAGETGVFATEISDYTVPADHRVEFLVNLTDATSGDIDIVTIALYGEFAP